MLPTGTAADKDDATPMLTVAEAARYLNVSEDTVRWWVRRKEVPFRKAGKHTRFVREELDRWTAEHAA